MSYEGQMLSDLEMPSKHEVEMALLKILFNNNGIVKEFNSNEEIVYELADQFKLNQNQRTAILERIYNKENRIVKSLLWHRLLFRAADSLSKQGFVKKPSITIKLTTRKEWMLTEAGYDKALELLNIPIIQKENLPVKSYEVQKIVKKLIEKQRPEIYNPFDSSKRTSFMTKEIKLRSRGFRQAIIDAYDYKCAVCGLKIYSPVNKQWEVEAAHIVPYSSNGKDDVWNGLGLCRLHHWAFDAGIFSLGNDYQIIVSNYLNNVSEDLGKMGNFNFMKDLSKDNFKINLPANEEIYPHKNSLEWHRENILYK